MISLNEKINHVINETINNYLLREALNNTDYPLYHFTTVESACDILASNSLRGSWHRGYANSKEDQHGICFTRNPKYQVWTESCVQFVFDTQELQKLARHAKLIPYQDPSWEGFGEQEERLISTNGQPCNIKNIDKAVKQINIFLYDLYEYVFEEVEGSYMYEVVEYLKEMFDNNLYKSKIHFLENKNNKKRIHI